MTVADNQQMPNQAYQEWLQKQGISHDDFQKIIYSDFAGASDKFKVGIKNYIRKVAKRKRDPKTGRFIAGDARHRKSRKWERIRQEVKLNDENR